jgi:hypothetical protein
MCYSYEASINSFIVILVAFFAVMSRKRSKYDTWIAIFLLYVGAMQFLEALLWKNMNNNSEITKWTTIYLIGQIVVNNIFAYVLNPEIGVYSLTASVLVLLYYLATMNDYTYDTTIGKNGHLVWNTYTKDTHENVGWYRSKLLLPVMTILWFLPFFIIMKDKVFQFWPFLYLLGTFLYSAYNGIKTSEMASNWCFFISFAMIGLVFVPVNKT